MARPQCDDWHTPLFCEEFDDQIEPWGNRPTLVLNTFHKLLLTSSKALRRAAHHPKNMESTREGRNPGFRRIRPQLHLRGRLLILVMARPSLPAHRSSWAITFHLWVLWVAKEGCWTWRGACNRIFYNRTTERISTCNSFVEEEERL